MIGLVISSSSDENVEWKHCRRCGCLILSEKGLQATHAHFQSDVAWCFSPLATVTWAVPLYYIPVRVKLNMNHKSLKSVF